MAKVLYPIMNHRGDVIALRDDTGSVIARREYNAFDQVLFESGDWSGFRMGYQSNWLEVNPGSGGPRIMLTPGGRTYMPELGRFGQRDPQSELGGSYIYASSNPVSRVDAEGREDQSVVNPHPYNNPALGDAARSLSAAQAELQKDLAEEQKAKSLGINAAPILLKDIAKRRTDIVSRNVELKNQMAIQEKWNALDAVIGKVVLEYNKTYFSQYSKGCPKGTPPLDPDLVKALIFTETKLGTDGGCRETVNTWADAVAKNPGLADAIVPYPGDTTKDFTFQINIGRVTYPATYRIAGAMTGRQLTYGDIAKGGSEIDVRLAVAALIYNLQYANSLVGKTEFVSQKSDPWKNAVTAYKSVNAEGLRHANLVWALYTEGVSPYDPDKRKMWSPGK